jgi:hypothetical protein
MSFARYSTSSRSRASAIAVISRGGTLLSLTRPSRRSRALTSALRGAALRPAQRCAYARLLGVGHGLALAFALQCDQPQPFELILLLVVWG